MLTQTQYDELKAKHDRFEQWRNGRASYRTDEIPADVPTVTNDERSAMEVFEFVTHPPERYFLYIKHPDVPSSFLGGRKQDIRYGSSGTATTWMGEKLGDVQFGRTFQSSFGDTRVSITIYAINGRTYHGTFYKSAGDYARVKMAKR